VGEGVESAAENEAEARYANENLEQAQQYLRPGKYLQIICECGRTGCGELLAITDEEYQELRSDPIHFAISRGHLIPEVDQVVRENDRFVTVAKRPGAAEAIAREEDPRS
jgi:5-bromo-4-chloroindolyl phosphate hydrolysis protein